MEGDAPPPSTNAKKNKRKGKKKKNRDNKEKSDAEDSTVVANTGGVKATPDSVRKTFQNARISDEEKANKAHKFWDTQPVPRLEETQIEAHEAIDEEKAAGDVRQEPYNLPPGFEWCDCDIMKQETVEEVYHLLHDNYVEDDDNMFRFDYSEGFLRWALTPPGYQQAWHAGVRNSANGKLLAFISAVPATIRAFAKENQMVEINFLCVHKKLRSKRLAPVLIKEITRRVNVMGVWQAVYTAGVVLPKPVASCRYYHRSLNPKKLTEVGFSHIPTRMTLNMMIRLYKLPEEPTIATIRPMREEDVPQAHQLVVKYLEQFKMACVFDEDEFRHWMLPREGVVDSFVVEDPNDPSVLTDMCSFYTLPSTIIGNQKYNVLKAAYSFYNVAHSVSLETLMQNALILAKNLDFDVFNALNIMENGSFVDKLKFGIGDGHLQYYFFNWRCPGIEPNDVGLVLL